MSNGDYSYTNDLDEGGVLGAVAPRHEQNHSPWAQVVAEMGDSDVNYEYLNSNPNNDNTLSADFGNNFGEVQTALALEDFVGVYCSNLENELFESNSVFDIGAGEQGTQSPDVASQQSVSGTDFDTLPIAPIAKQPIDASRRSPPPSLTRQQPLPTTTTTTAATTSGPTRRPPNASSSNYDNTSVNGTSLMPALVGASAVAQAPASPMKYADTYGIANPSAVPSNTHSPQHLSSDTKHGREVHEHPPASKPGSGVAGSSIGPYGLGGRGAKPSSAKAASTRTGRPAPPPLQPSTIQSKTDAEDFSFGIETFLHGTQLGFGRQPSFKRIAAGAPSPTNNTSKPYYLIPGMTREGNNLPAAAPAVNSSLGPPMRPAAGADRNAEAFSTWLEALEPKANSNASSPRSLRAVAANNTTHNSTNNSSTSPATVGPSVREDFKREVDVMMKDLLGDYDLTGGMTGVLVPNTTVASGLPLTGLSTANGGTFSGRQSSLSTGGGGKDTTRQLEYDAFLKDMRMLTPTARSPAAGVAAANTAARDERRKQQAKASETTGVAAAAASPKSILNTIPAVAPARSPRAAKKGNATASAAPGPQTGLPQPPDGSGSQARRRPMWNNSVPATSSSGEGTSGAAVGPTTEAAEPLKPSPPRGSKVSVSAHQTPPRPAVATRPLLTTASMSASEQSARLTKTPPRRLSSPRSERSNNNRTPLFPGSETYDGMDEDLLAGGYMTGASVLRSAESLPDASSPMRGENVDRMMRMPRSPPKKDRTGASSPHGRRFSSMDGHIGASAVSTSLMRQKRHPSCKKSGTSSAAAAAPSGRSPEQVSGVQAATSPRRRTSIPSLSTSKTRLSGDSGTRATNPLPLPSFAPNHLPNTNPQRGASTSRTSPMQRDSIAKGASVLTMNSVSRASRRAGTSPTTVEPVTLADRERQGFLQRVGAFNSENRDDVSLSVGRSGAAAPPRRRLLEFRSGGGDAGLLPCTSRSRISITHTAEDARAEAARQRDREREVQQANEERRQRIQAFMAKRKAEKQMEELRRGQLMERDRKLEAYREEQERHRIYETTAPEPVTTTSTQQQQQQPGAVAGSGFNAIKASQRTRRPTLERLQRPSVPSSNFIPEVSTVPMTPQAVRNEPAPDAAPQGQRTAGPKTKVRAVVVFISSDEAANASKKSGKNETPHRLSSSSTGCPTVYEGTSVVMKRDETDKVLKVLQPQERPRYFNVDEYVLINDATPSALSKSRDRGGGGGGITGSYDTANALRNAAGARRRRLISLTLTEMSRKFLAGVNVALLLASTENAQEATVLAVREVVEGVVSHMRAQSQLFVSVAYVAGGNTEDLLVDPPRPVRSTFRTSPLYGPTLDGVDYVPVTGAGHLLRTVAVAYKRVKEGQPPPESGLLVISLLLKQCRDSDVILSSYLISDAGVDGSLYTAILRKSPHSPFALFHSALGGPTLTTVLMATDAADVTAAVPLLNVQHRLCTIMNKPCHVGSVRRFSELAQRELDTASDRASKGGGSNRSDAKTSISSNGGNSTRQPSGNSFSSTLKSPSSRRLSSARRQRLGASRPQIHKRLAEQVAVAKQILANPQGYLPKGVLSTDSEKGSSVTIQSVPCTAPPSAAMAPRTQLTRQQEDEIKDLQLSNVGQPRKGSYKGPATAAAAAAVTAGNVGGANRTKMAAATEAEQTQTIPSDNGVVLPSIAPGSAAAPVCTTPAQRDLTAAACAPPGMSAVPLKHPGAAPTELVAPQLSARRSSNYLAAATTAGNASAANSSRDAREASSVRNSLTSATYVPLAASHARFSRSDADMGAGGAAPLPLRQSVLNEQSMSTSATYVRRGRDNGDGAARRNTGFMNFEDGAVSQSMPTTETDPDSNNNAQQQQLQRPRNPTKAPPDHLGLPPWPATTMAPTSDAATGTAPRNSSAARRRGSADEGRPGSGLPPFALPSVIAGPAVASVAGSKRLLPSATPMGSTGPQWPSTPGIEIPTILSVTSIDTSFTRDVSVSMQQSSNAYESDKAPLPTSTKVRTLVILDSHCRETSNVTYDNTMVIATTEDDFEEYDVDEVREATPGQKELIQADLLKELCDTLLRGCNAAILGADSRPTGFSAQVLKSVVHTIFAEMHRADTPRSGRLSASIVKVKGESVVDLLQDSGDAQKLVIAISPLFGSCVHGVTYADVSSGAGFDDTIDAALGRAASHDNGRDYGFVFCSLLFKLRLEEEGDVQVCSLVATFAGENVGLYTSVLDRSPLVPRALFHYALGGPSYTIALLGIGSEETRANQMLQVQKRLGEMSNRATHPGSVAKFVAGIRNDLTPNLIAKYESSRDPSERAATKEMIERLAEMVKDADALLVDFDHHQPKAYLHGDAEQQQQQQQPPGGAADNNSNNKQLQQIRSTSLSVSPATAGIVSASGDGNDTNRNKRSSGAAGLCPHGISTPARPTATQRALPTITAVNPDAEGERIQSLVCFKQEMMGAGTVAVQGNTILCASQGGTRFDSDEVITCDENHRSLSSKLMDDLVAKFLSGHHTGLLAADSSYSAFTPLMLRHIANNIIEAVLGGSGSDHDEDNGFAFTKPPTISGELQVSIALIKDDVTADLLPIDVDATYHRFEVEHTPLYGPRVIGITPHLVANPQDFDHFLAVAIDNADPALQTADPGIMVVSLVLTQRVTKPVEDVLVSSLLCTAVFDAVHHYERVLEGNPGEPLDLFKNVLRGPCFSVALLGISDEEEDPGKLLRVLNDLSQVRNRAPQVNSVSRHIRELQRGIVKLKERMTTSSNGDEKAYIKSRVEVAENLLEEAESLQRNPLSLMQPRAFVPLGGTSDLH
ncbi:hypothetical protein ABB37_02379 [Leptomonas pyrrhocoris]|uniref:Uncharacterized protein n=1 Tax=Leptomonas pyrrhocoris TaxID=157538 RepID=A0A0M9G844_LEPPY|nr:hypothetical protein ABB37_02379 [Leptomonas pyrrhocoris]KPA84396.1 hypothetical protein ABB37_02379 [Leptomonas pyrrhocoris]|eukprot:XP_015662835.1 hypothetical protein ABB37_02379 [Leptomonas pyrrhocoris]